MLCFIWAGSSRPVPRIWEHSSQRGRIYFLSCVHLRSQTTAKLRALMDQIVHMQISCLLYQPLVMLGSVKCIFTEDNYSASWRLCSEFVLIGWVSGISKLSTLLTEVILISPGLYRGEKYWFTFFFSSLSSDSITCWKCSASYWKYIWLINAISCVIKAKQNKDEWVLGSAPLMEPLPFCNEKAALLLWFMIFCLIAPAVCDNTK